MSASDASAFYMFHGCNKFCRCASLCRACAAPLFWLPSPLFFHCLVVGRTPRQWLRTSLSSTRQPDSCDALPSRHRQSCTRTHTKQNGGHEMMLVSCVHIFSSPLLPPAHVNFERTRNVCFHESSLVDCSDAFYLFSLVFCCLFLYGCVPVGVCVCVPPRLRQRSARRAVPEIPFFFLRDLLGDGGFASFHSVLSIPCRGTLEGNPKKRKANTGSSSSNANAHTLIFALMAARCVSLRVEPLR